MTSYGARVEAVAAALYDKGWEDQIRWGSVPAWGDTEHRKPLSEGERDVWREEAETIVRRLNDAGVFLVSRVQDGTQQRDGIPLTQQDVDMLDGCLEHPETHQDTLASYAPKLLDCIDGFIAAEGRVQARVNAHISAKRKAENELARAKDLIGVLWRSRRGVQSARALTWTMYRRMRDRKADAAGFRSALVKMTLGMPPFVSLVLPNGEQVTGYVYPEPGQSEVRHRTLPDGGSVSSEARPYSGVNAILAENLRRNPVYPYGLGDHES